MALILIVISGCETSSGITVVSLSLAVTPAEVTRQVGEEQSFTATVMDSTVVFGESDVTEFSTITWIVRLNGKLEPVLGGTGPTLTLTPASPGTYTVFAEASFSGASTKSNVATLSVTAS